MGAKKEQQEVPWLTLLLRCSQYSYAAAVAIFCKIAQLLFYLTRTCKATSVPLPGCLAACSGTAPEIARVAGWMVLEPGRLCLLLGLLVGPPMRLASCSVVLIGSSSLACNPGATP